GDDVALGTLLALAVAETLASPGKRLDALRRGAARPAARIAELPLAEARLHGKVCRSPRRSGHISVLVLRNRDFTHAGSPAYLPGCAGSPASSDRRSCRPRWRCWHRPSRCGPRCR